jgi:hypothetical protein
MRRTLAALASLALASCMSPPGFDYTGPDAGAVILSLSADEAKIPLASYSLTLHRAQAAASENDLLLWMSPSAKRGPFETDYLTGTQIDQTRGTAVYVRKLKPRDYTVLAVIFESPGPNVVWAGTERTHLAFTVKPNQAIYLGSFVAHIVELGKTDLIATPVQGQPSLALLFTLSSEYERDLAVARQKHPELHGATVSVPDPTKPGWPFGPAPSKT